MVATRLNDSSVLAPTDELTTCAASVGAQKKTMARISQHAKCWALVPLRIARAERRKHTTNLQADLGFDSLGHGAKFFDADSLQLFHQPLLDRHRLLVQAAECGILSDASTDVDVHSLARLARGILGSGPNQANVAHLNLRASVRAAGPVQSHVLLELELAVKALRKVVCVPFDVDLSLHATLVLAMIAHGLSLDALPQGQQR